MIDFNTQVIEEFRANQGRVGGRFEGMPVVLVHHLGRRTGAQRVNPLAYQRVGDGWAVFGSYQGSAKHPDWYLNLMASPHTTVEIGTETHQVVARDAVGDERDEIFARQCAASPIFAEYQEKAGERVIPVVVLEPVL